MATYMARWGPKGFLTSPTKVVPFNGFSTSLDLKSDSENDTSGTAPTNTRGRELRQISFETTYFAAAGVDPRGQVDEWESLLGQSYPLYIGDRRFGPAKMTLTSVSTSDVQITASGSWISCKISLNLEEYSEGGTSALTSQGSSNNKDEAMNATASASDRQQKK